jgi:hypothetical protein
MYFKLSYTIRNFWLHEQEEDFVFEKEKIEIKLYKASEEDIKKGYKYDTIFCDAIIELEPHQKDLEICSKIIQRIPLEINTKDTRGYTITNEDVEYFVPHIDSFPQHFRDFHSKINDKLSSSIKNCINNIMWVCNYNGGHNPFSVLRFIFSLDKTKWEDMPSNINVGVSLLEFPIRLSEKGRQIVSSRDAATPIHHSLFLEAWSQKTVNKRSSLIMGLAALESSVKYMIVKNVPDAVWMIENSPSPSVLAMLRDMPTTLPIKNMINGEIKTPSKEILGELQKWIGVRNKLIHKGTELPKTFKIESILRTIKSIIYLMDYYSGEEWAIVYVNKELFEPIKS